MGEIIPAHPEDELPGHFPPGVTPGGERQVECWERQGSSGTGHLPFWKGVCTSPFLSHQRSLSFQGGEWKHSRNKIPRTPLVGVRVVGTEGNGKNVPGPAVC